MDKKLPDFLIIPSVIILDKTLQPLDGYVYGVVYWYSKLKLEKCIASSKTIAEIVNSNEGSVQNSINRLLRKGYLKSLYDRSKHVRELVPLVSFTKKDEVELLDTTTSDDVLPPHQMMESTTSNDGENQPEIGRGNKKIKEEEFNNTVNGEINFIKKLPNLRLLDEEKQYIYEYILSELKDQHSVKFYALVASKVPESVIRQALSEIKVDGAESPAKVFTYRMKKYAMLHQSL